MRTIELRALLSVVVTVFCASAARAEDIARFAVNEYFGVPYSREPVSFDVTFPTPVPAAKIGLRPGPCQVEVVEGTADAVKKARVWTMVDFRSNTYSLSAEDVLDWPGLIARINAEAAAEKPTVGRLAWESIRKQLGLPREAEDLGAKGRSDADKAAVLQGINDFIGRAQKQSADLLAACGLDGRFPDEVARLKDRRVSSDVVGKLHRAAIDASWAKLVRPHRRHPRQIIFTVHTDGGAAAAPAGPAATDAGKIAGVAVAAVANGLVSVKVPVGSATYDVPASPYDVPGPVVSISRDGKQWIGSGYLDSTLRVRAVTCQVTAGPVFFESKIHYAFENDRHYRARVRVCASKPYAQLTEDFDLGGASRFVFNYEDWFADAFFRTGDNKLCGWESIAASNPCADFVRIKGQEALARMVIWTQFNYFGGKQETIALKAPEPAALKAAHVEAVAKYQRDLKRYRDQVAEQDRQLTEYRQAEAAYPAKLADYRKQLAAYKADPKNVRKPKEPRKPAKPRERSYREPREPAKIEYAEATHTLAGASIRATSVATPGGDSTAVGGFYIRPDRWTRAKVNHVDMYMRPEVPGNRMTRGIVGLAGARLRIAMEAWLVDGHREWAIFAVRSGDSTWLAKAHVREGVWPLDRIRRLPLVWNSDGSAVKLADTRPPDAGGAPGPARRVLLDTRGRSGLQTFNGSEGGIRGTKPPAGGWDGKVKPIRAAAGSPENLAMAGEAMTAYLSADDSAYPSFRAMLPWTDPEAINPFYQGMENMNFNADLYRYVTTHGLRLAAMGHPQWERFVAHGEKSLDMALDRYVYPQSGCWEESHGYAGHTLHTVAPLAVALKNSGRRNFLEDLRLARMLEFFLYVHSPIDAEWGNRVVPAVGDHGQSRQGPAKRLGESIGLFAESKDPAIRKIVARAAWMIREDGGEVPEHVTPEKPDLTSRWLQGYGTVMRAAGKAPAAGGAAAPESFLVLRAGQSWGHHHEDKGSMWFWGRNVHFFGDCDWGAPPGGTYWNKYKQGPASGTQIELLGVTNWTLPCKYAAPWISDDEYADEFDYANARCMYPFNPKLDLSRSTPVALRNGYDRQVLFVHPDLLIVRDNVESTCPTIWRMHSFQPKGTKVEGSRATLASAQGAAGELAVLYPAGGVKLRLVDRDILNDKYFDGDGKPLPFEQLPQFKSSVEIRWDMPANTPATWVFAVRGDGEKAPPAELLDEAGRVTRVRLPDGREIVAMLNIDPFTYTGQGVEFEGTVGLVIRGADSSVKTYPIRSTIRVAK